MVELETQRPGQLSYSLAMGGCDFVVFTLKMYEPFMQSSIAKTKAIFRPIWRTKDKSQSTKASAKPKNSMLCSSRRVPKPDTT